MKQTDFRISVSPLIARKILRGDVRDLYDELYGWHTFLKRQDDWNGWISMANSKLLRLFKRRTPSRTSGDESAAMKRLQNARNTLVEYGFIEYQRGIGGAVCPKYKINECLLIELNGLFSETNLDEIDFFIESGDEQETNPYPKIFQEKIGEETPPCEFQIEDYSIDNLPF